MANFAVSAELYDVFRRHMVGDVEQVGFFLGDYEARDRLFVLQEWRPVAPEAFEIQSAYHVTLIDDVRSEVIKWAWDSGKSLVEAHSHGDKGVASFSASDTWGFSEWVPHLWWRLRGRPYAAIVTAGETFDALAWIDAADRPEQVDHLEVQGRSQIGATARTLATQGNVKEGWDAR